MDNSKVNNSVFRSRKFEDTYHLTPDHPDFYKQDVNLAILTKYGRGIYIRHGNQDRCSSFFATLGTIVNKLQLSFGTSLEGQEKPATLKCIKQGPLRLYILRRLNYLYICWSKGPQQEISLYGMMEFVHHQLMSCLTGQVNTILDTNQTYDPSINFGKTRAQHLLLHHAFANGMNSLPITFNALPIMHLPAQTRSTIFSLFKEQKIEGLQISILMTLNQVISIYKQKGIQMTCYDIFLLITLIQSQSSLFKSQIWYPICLPGVEFQSRVFCYINFITDQVIHIMIADEANIFSQLSQASKNLKIKCQQVGVFERIHFSARKQLINDPSLDRLTYIKHFIIRFSPNDDYSLHQMTMSSGSYFGQNQEQFNQYLPLYSQLQHHLLTNRHPKREKLHIQPIGELVGGYFEQGNLTVFFLCSQLCQLQDCRGFLNSLMKFTKQEEQNLWIHKFV